MARRSRFDVHDSFGCSDYGYYGFSKMLTKKVPAALTAIIVVSLIVIFGGIETETVKSFIVASGGEGIKAGLPTFNIPLIDLNCKL